MLAVLAFAAYSNSFQAGFALDSKGLILQDARVHAATAANADLILDHTYWWPYGESGLYRPATTFSYLLNFAVLGNGIHPAGYHWLNFLLHLVNVLLVYLLARRILGEPTPAWFVAAVWAVHPVLTESVTNIVGRSDLLAAGAVLSGLLLYVRSRDAAGWRRLAWCAGLAAATTLGVFSKENAVAIVGVVVLYEIAWWRPRSPANLAWGGAAILPPLMAMLVKRSAVLAAAGPAALPFTDNPIVGAGFWTGRLTAAAVLGRELWLSVWPATLSCDYSYNAIPLASGRAVDWLAWMTVTAAAALTIAAYWRSRRAFFWAAFACVTIVPTSNLLVTIGAIMAERFLYLPSVGIIACLVLATFGLGRVARVKALAPAALCVALAALAARTFVRNRDWRDDVTLGAATVEAQPASYKGYKVLAGALYDADPARGNIDAVVTQAKRALAVIDPLPDALNDGEMYLQAAGYYLDKGERQRGDAADAPAAVPPERRGPYEQAVPLLRRAEAIGQAQRRARPDQAFAPRFADVYRLLSVAYLRLGDPARALDAAVEARSVAPLDPDAYARMADAELTAGHADAAAVALTEGVMMTASQPLAQALMNLYREGLDPDGCAVIGSGAAATLNPRCPAVRRHLCTATAGTLKLLLQTGRRDLAARMKATALGPLGCDPAPLDAAMPGP